MGTFSVIAARPRKNSLVETEALFPKKENVPPYFRKKENVPGYSAPRMITCPHLHSANVPGVPE
jgi:hypothetical protein